VAAGLTKPAYPRVDSPTAAACWPGIESPRAQRDREEPCLQEAPTAAERHAGEPPTALGPACWVDPFGAFVAYKAEVRAFPDAFSSSMSDEELWEEWETLGDHDRSKFAKLP